MAAGNGGAENMAATVLILVIQDCICSAFLTRGNKHRDYYLQHMTSKGRLTENRAFAVDKEVMMKPIKVGEERACFLEPRGVSFCVSPWEEREREREQEGGRRRERLGEREIGSGGV